MSDAPLAPRVLRGIEFHFMGQIAAMAVNLYVTPLIVHGLGTDGYALYALMWTLSGYLIVLNLGTGATIQRYVSYYRGREESASLSSLLRRLLVFHVLMSLLAAGLLLAGKDWVIARFVHAHGPALDAAPRVVLFVALAAPAYFLLQFGLNTLYGLQRFGAYNLFLALQSFAVAVCAAGLLFMGKGLTEIAWAFAGAHAALALGALWSVRAVLLAPGERLKNRKLREIVRFSFKSFSNLFLWTAIFQGDRAFIGSMLPLAQLGFYAIPSSLMQKLNMFSGAVAATTFPMISELHGRGQEERLRRLYLKASELSFFFLLPLTIIIFVLAPQFLSLWLGAEFSRWGTWPLRLLLLANLVYFATYLPNSVVVSKGRPEIYAYLQLGKALALICSWPLLIPRYGIAGAAIGTLLAELLCAPLFVGYVHKRFLAIGWRTFFIEACWRPAAAGAALLALGLGVHARAGTWPRLIASGATGAALYLFTGYCLLEPEAKALLRDWLKRKTQSTC